jgi:hypothetical protein
LPPLERVQAVALLEVHVRVAAAPLVTVGGAAAKVTVGGSATVTV